MKSYHLTAVLVGQAAVLRLPKNASTSMHAYALEHSLPITSEFNHLTIPLYIFIREPLERFYSAATSLANAGTHPFYPKDMTYREFVDYTLTHYNPHWDLQLDLTWGLPLDNLYRFEDLPYVWERKLGLAPLPRQNQSPIEMVRAHQKIEPNYRRKELERKYLPDNNLRLQLISFNER